MKRVRPLVALYGSLRATPSLWSGAKFALYRTLVWLIDGTRVWRRLNVATGTLCRRARMTFTLEGPTGRPVRVTLPVVPQAYWTLYEIFFNQAYRPLLPLRPAVVVDAGANIGLATLYLNALYPDARFLCVEADPSNLALLRRNLEANGVRHEVIHAALGARGGVIPFRVHRSVSDYSSCRSTSFAREEYREVSVPAATLQDLLAARGIGCVGLCKIDIEGSEFEVLDPASLALGQFEYVVGEFHGFAGDIAQLTARLLATGLRPVKSVGDAKLAVIHFAR